MNIWGYRLERENILSHRTNMFVKAWTGVAWQSYAIPPIEID